MFSEKKRNIARGKRYFKSNGLISSFLSKNEKHQSVKVQQTAKSFETRIENATTGPVILILNNEMGSAEVSESLAIKIYPYGDGSWTDKLQVKAVGKMFLKSVHSYKNLSLSGHTVCERIKYDSQ